MVLPVLPPNDAVAQARLAQRLAELLQRRLAAVGGAEPARPVDALSHHPHLPSRQGLDRLAQAGTALPAPASSGRPAAAPQEPAPALSAAARALAAILYRSEGAEVPPVRAARPVWAGAEAPAGTLLAPALARAVRESGLFYESHLQELAAGTRSPAQLRHEPQAALPSAPPGDSAAAMAPVLHPATTDLVRQQLELMASGVFRWSGEVWPGTPMDWEIREERGQEDPSSGDTPAAWSTSLRLTLPALGTVEARLALVAGALRVRLLAQDEAGSTRLQGGRAALLGRLQAAGATVLACEIGAAP